MLLHHCLLFKPIINNLKSFISGTSEVVFFIFFCSNIAASKTSFWARPLKTAQGHVFSLEAHLEVLLAAFLKKRISTLITTGNNISKF